jgi:hypothetical protein
MKQLFFTVLLCATILMSYAGNHQTASKQKAKGNSSKFAGKWKGSENCTDASAPVALLYITSNGAEILLTGIYSLQGQVKAVAKGDTIVIPQQDVIDPNFKNLIIEGKLAYTTNPNSLAGKITVLNNQKKDECAVKYYK